MITIVVNDENALHAVLRALRHEWHPDLQNLIVQMNPIPATRDVAAAALPESDASRIKAKG